MRNRMLFCAPAVENFDRPRDPRASLLLVTNHVLKRPRNYHRMRVIPGSSTVEHSAVNFTVTVDSAPFSPDIGHQKQAKLDPSLTSRY